MSDDRILVPEFEKPLSLKDPELITLFRSLRTHILELCPSSNELLYHTHALTDLFSLSDKMSDGFCMIPIYTNHLNLGFNKGSLLKDPNSLLEGTGKLIRHIPIKSDSDFRKPEVADLIQEAYQLAVADQSKPSKFKATVISKIKA